ncbi:MAG TPA: hypothetical protein VEC36_06960 [Patescibacteria group bacterium]|nr:hypothetical protein [Patescibacteria group bacterium]
MKKLLKPAILAGMLLLGSCDDETATNPTPQNAVNYFPLTYGSTWTYELTTDGVSSTTKDSITGDTLINGRSYVNILSYTAGTTPYSYTESYRKNGDTIFIRHENTDLITLIGRSGSMWRETITADNYENKTTYSVVHSGVTHTVEGTTYSDAIHVKKIQVITTTGVRDTLRSDIYFAKNVGLIEQVLPSGTLRLKNYTVK